MLTGVAYGRREVGVAAHIPVHASGLMQVRHALRNVGSDREQRASLPAFPAPASRVAGALVA